MNLKISPINTHKFVLIISTILIDLLVLVGVVITASFSLAAAITIIITGFVVRIIARKLANVFYKNEQVD